MTDVIDYRRFAERLASTGPRWELLRAVQEEWGYEPPGGEPRWPRWSESAHKAYVRRLKKEMTGEEDDLFAGVDMTLPIPAALDEWWDLPFNSFTYRPRLYWTNPEYPPTIHPDPSGVQGSSYADQRVCVFMTEYQCCNEWGYLAAEAAHPDPRVFVSTEDGWELQSRSISEFFLQLALMRLPEHYGWSVALDLEPDVKRRIRELFPDLGLLPWRELGSRTTAHGALDAILFLDEGNGDWELCAYARTRDALTEIARTLGLDWSDEIAPPMADQPEPLSLSAGDADPDDLWRVESVSTAPYPESPAVPPAEILAKGLAVWAEDPDAGAAGADGNGVHVWPTEGGHSRIDHSTQVTAVAIRLFDEIGITVASGDADGLVNLWHPDDEPFELGREHGKVVSIDGALLGTRPTIAAAWNSGTVRLWDIAAGTRATLNLGQGIETLRLESNGTLTVGGPGGSAVLRLDTHRLLPSRQIYATVRRFDWSRYECATGPADDLPGLFLAVLLSDDVEKPIADLRAALCEGGQVYSAALPAIPCVMRLVAEDDRPGRWSLLALLGEIMRNARGTEEYPQRVWAQSVLSVLEDMVEALCVLLEDDDPSVRAATALLVAEAWTGRVADPLPALLERIAEETEPEPLSALVAAVALLAGDDTDPALFSRLLTDSAHHEVRAAAAVALRRLGRADENITEAIDRELAAPESALDRPLRAAGLTRPSFLKGKSL